MSVRVLFCGPAEQESLSQKLVKNPPKERFRLPARLAREEARRADDPPRQSESASRNCDAAVNEFDERRYYTHDEWRFAAMEESGRLRLMSSVGRTILSKSEKPQKATSPHSTMTAAATLRSKHPSTPSGNGRHLKRISRFESR